MYNGRKKPSVIAFGKHLNTNDILRYIFVSIIVFYHQHYHDYNKPHTFKNWAII